MLILGLLIRFKMIKTVGKKTTTTENILTCILLVFCLEINCKDAKKPRLVWFDLKQYQLPFIHMPECIVEIKKRSENSRNEANAQVLIFRKTPEMAEIATYFVIFERNQSNFLFSVVLSL